MRSRSVATAALVVALLAACAKSEPPAASLTPSPPSPTVSRDQRSDLELVRAAYRATRAAKTGTFIVKGVTGVGPGIVTLHREGSYDLGRSLMSLTQRITAFPPELLAQMTGEDVEDPELTMHSVVSGTHAYLQMPGWGPPADKRWLRFSADDIEGQAGYAPDLDAAIFPPAVDVLRHAEVSAQDGDGRSASPPVLHVVVPAGMALHALPSAVARKLLDAGVDLESLGGEVEVEVEVTEGLVRAVRYDALEAFKAAMAEAGQRNATRGLTEVSAEATLDNAGQPVRIVVPAASQVMSREEFESYAR